MKSNAGVAEVTREFIKPCNHLEPEKKLAVNTRTGKVNPYFYEDSTLTPEGKRKLERAFNEGQARIQGKREKLLEEGRRIRELEKQIKKRKEHFILEVKTFEERFKQPVYIC